MGSSPDLRVSSKLQRRVRRKTLQRREFRDDERMREEFLRATERQADRLLQLVQNLLAASQVENQQLRLSVGPVWLSDVVADVVG